MSHPIRSLTDETMFAEVSPDVMALKDLDFKGSIVPDEWHNHITFGNGQPDFIAINILADIVYWHRPVEVRDVSTGHVLRYRQKFKEDLLQKTYQNYAIKLNISKRQAIDAFGRLEQLGLLRRIFRTVPGEKGPVYNVLYIKINVAKIREISESVMTKGTSKSRATCLQGAGLSFVQDPQSRDQEDKISRTHSEKTIPHTIRCSSALQEEKDSEAVETTTPSHAVAYPPLRQDVNGFTPERGTYTEITSKITTKTSPLTRVREEVATQLLEIWNQTFGQSLLMTASRGVKLVQGLDRYFAGDIRAWQLFCERVLSSAFLQGQGPRGWRASLDWCLEESNLVKILEGNYCDKTSKAAVSPTACESLSKAQSYIETLGAKDHLLAQEVCEHLGPNIYSSWFEGMKVAGRTQDRILLTFPTKFIRNTVDIRYLGALREIIQKLSPGCWLELGVEGDTLAFNATPAVISERPETAVSEYVKPVPVSRDTPRPMLKIVKDLAKSLVSLDARPMRTLEPNPEDTALIPASASRAATDSVIDRAGVSVTAHGRVPVTDRASVPIPDGVLKPVTGGASVSVTAHGRVPVVVDDRSIDQKDSEVAYVSSWNALPQMIPGRGRERDEGSDADERLRPSEEPWAAQKERSTAAFSKPMAFSLYRTRKLEDSQVSEDESGCDSVSVPWDIALHPQRTRACA